MSASRVRRSQGALPLVIRATSTGGAQRRRAGRRVALTHLVDERSDATARLQRASPHPRLGKPIGPCDHVAVPPGTGIQRTEHTGVGRDLSVIGIIEDRRDRGCGRSIRPSRAARAGRTWPEGPQARGSIHRRHGPSPEVDGAPLPPELRSHCGGHRTAVRVDRPGGKPGLVRARCAGTATYLGHYSL